MISELLQLAASVVYRIRAASELLQLAASVVYSRFDFAQSTNENGKIKLIGPGLGIQRWYRTAGFREQGMKLRR